MTKQPPSPDAALLKELSLYLNADELPPYAELRPSLPARALASARRLRQAVGDAQVPALADRIAALASSREDPLHGEIMNRTMIYWPDEDDSWDTFTTFANLLVEALRSPAR